jgi:DnaJ-class molecular chaperone
MNELLEALQSVDKWDQHNGGVMPLSLVKQVQHAIALATEEPEQPREEWCDGCDGTGLMEGWNRRDGNSCPKCKGSARVTR